MIILAIHACMPLYVSVYMYVCVCVCVCMCVCVCIYALKDRQDTSIMHFNCTQIYYNYYFILQFIVIFLLFLYGSLCIVSSSLFIHDHRDQARSFLCSFNSIRRRRRKQQKKTIIFKINFIF